MVGCVDSITDNLIDYICSQKSRLILTTYNIIKAILSFKFCVFKLFL